MNIGILGGGQLAMMMSASAIKMGYTVYVLDPTEQCPASVVGAKQIVGSFNNSSDIRNFINKQNIDILTWDIESIDVDTLIKMHDLNKDTCEIRPDPHVLKMIQNKWTQKGFYNKHKFPTTAVFEHDLLNTQFDYPMIMKTKFGGYDGKGVWKVSNYQEAVDIILASNLEL
ncbi:ATP-grasp domain-containing protein, partial [bacterium]|nr:ATP-grasp domain-containing protein [bacterium]